MLDLFCGRGGWTKAFLARGWECVGVDLVRHPEYRGEFIEADILDVTATFVRDFDFVCASSPCEEFSVHGLKHFHKNPKFPDMGLVLFCWTRRLLDSANVPYVMENVRAAEQFVGRSNHKCGPFYMWGNAVPPLVHQGISKGTGFGKTREQRKNGADPTYHMHAGSKKRKEYTAKIAEIPPELANCVADYAERLCEQRLTGKG